MMRIITLTTDFGTRDEYVGVIKGVILKINPTVIVVDITHEVPPQDVVQAGDLLKSAYAWFPEGTIHLTVVDPGVGTGRAVLAARFAGHYFLAPDNGLLPMVWGEQHLQGLVRVEDCRYCLKPVSNTFHGRDIFAPVAARLASGLDLNELGPPVTSSQIQPSAAPPVEWTSDREVLGRVTGADHFGNLRTNIDHVHLERLVKNCRNEALVVTVGTHAIQGVAVTYGSGRDGRLIALVNSRNQLEIAVAGGSAARVVRHFEGLAVRVFCR